MKSFLSVFCHTFIWKLTGVTQHFLQQHIKWFTKLIDRVSLFYQHSLHHLSFSLFHSKEKWHKNCATKLIDQVSLFYQYSFHSFIIVSLKRREPLHNSSLWMKWQVFWCTHRPHIAAYHDSSRYCFCYCYHIFVYLIAF